MIARVDGAHDAMRRAALQLPACGTASPSRARRFPDKPARALLRQAALSYGELRSLQAEALARAGCSARRMCGRATACCCSARTARSSSSRATRCCAPMRWSCRSTRCARPTKWRMSSTTAARKWRWSRRNSRAVCCRASSAAHCACAVVIDYADALTAQTATPCPPAVAERAAPIATVVHALDRRAGAQASADPAPRDRRRSRRAALHLGHHRPPKGCMHTHGTLLAADRAASCGAAGRATRCSSASRRCSTRSACRTACTCR